MRYFFTALLVTLSALAETKMRNTSIQGAPINVMDKGAKCDDATDDTLAFQAALDAIGPSGTARMLVLPPGNCVITATLNLSGFVGARIEGYGYKTVLKWKGGSSGPMFFLSGTRETIFNNFKMQPYSASFPIATMVVQEQPPLVSGLTSTMNTYRNLQIAGLGVITQGIYVKGDVTDANNDYTDIEKVFINGYTEAGILLQGANAFETRIVNCQLGGGSVGHYGVKSINGLGAESGHFAIHGGAFLGHTTADVYVQTRSALPFLLDNLYSEQSAAYLIEDGPHGSATYTVIRGARFATANIGAPPIIIVKNPGPVLIENSNLGTDYAKSPTIQWTYSAGFSPPTFRVANTRISGNLNTVATIFTSKVPTTIQDSYWMTSGTVFGSLVPVLADLANMGVLSNGATTPCADCTIANPCAGGGTGAFAKRLNGVWVCN